MIKRIVFDNGGVMVKVSSKYFLPYYARMLKIPLKKLEHVYWQLSTELDVGKESEKEFYRKLLKHVNRKYDYKKLLKVRYSLIKFLPGTLDIVKKLKKKYKLAMLNNEYKECMNHLKKKYNYFSYFQPRITSSEVGVRKPEAKIYKIMLKKLRIKPSECLFLDDLQLNFNTAKKIGIKTIHFKNAKQLRKELNKFGIEV